MDANDIIIKSIGQIANWSTPPENRNCVVGRTSAVKQYTDDDGTVIDYVVVTPIDSSLTDISFVRLSPDDTVAPSQTPVENSIVVVNLSDGNAGHITQFGQVEKVQLAVSNATGRKNYGGLIIIQDLVDKINTLEDTVNKLRSMMITLIDDYNGHKHSVIAVGSPTSVPDTIDVDTAPAEITKTKVSDIENPVVQHGNGSVKSPTYQADLEQALTSLNIQQIVTDNAYQNYTISGSDSTYNIYLKAKTLLDKKQAEYNKLVANPK